jgi:hypothetical protein
VRRCVLSASRAAQSPLDSFGWRSEEVPIGDDGFCLVKARALFSHLLCSPADMCVRSLAALARLTHAHSRAGGLQDRFRRGRGTGWRRCGD